jgi:hypothetical protein
MDMKQSELIFKVGLGLVFMIGLAIFMAMRERNKSQNLYGFEFDGWSSLADDQMLYQIELLFTQGLVAQAFRQSGYGVSEWHSNLVHRDGRRFTGFISLVKTATVTTINTSSSDSFPFNYGWTYVGGSENRYFLGQLTKSQPELIFVQTPDLSRSLPVRVAGLIDVFREMDRDYGVNQWAVIAFMNQVVILAPELLEEKRIARFLSHADRIFAMLEA